MTQTFRIATAQGCRCPQCFGLAEYMQATIGEDLGLPHAQGHAIGPPVSLQKPCDGTMTCACKTCEQERAALIAKAGRRVHQPWDIAA